MEDVIRDILARLRAEAAGQAEPLDGRGLARMLDERNRREGGPRRRYAKKMLLPFYLRVRAEEPERWRTWDVDDALEERLVALLRMKPRRTASGVATVTVITKPWPCAGRCLYCPNDVRMPKSYLADEPACQRAERAFFDPYIQVSARLRTLAQMGHPVDKVELIVLGGTWSDYPAAYRRWFVAELFRALDDGVGPAADARAADCRWRYESLGLPAERDDCAAFVADAQRAVDAGRLTYNQAVRALYGAGSPRSVAPGDPADLAGEPDAPSAASAPWPRAAAFQEASWDDVEAAQRANETAACRCVGLVVETRPELVDVSSLAELRRLGCTKVQMGVQSLDPAVLAASGRGDAKTVDAVARAFALLRLFGFKIHAHFMANLPGATPAADAGDYRLLVTDGRFLPDEVKLYPCVLTAGTALAALHEAGEWEPYGEDELVALLADDVRATPPFTRISRMIRDIAAHDIVAGNRKANLRQLVDRSIAGEDDGTASAPLVQEIRSREIAGEEVDEDALRLDAVPYDTAVSRELFLQWVTDEGRIAGFLRLSLPRPEALAASPGLPVGSGEAMIREVHVYGRTSPLARIAAGVQHRGLGRRLVEEACVRAAVAGYDAINVISAVGTRGYYRRLGFQDAGLYQRRALARREEAAPGSQAADAGLGRSAAPAVAMSDAAPDDAKAPKGCAGQEARDDAKAAAPAIAGGGEPR